MTQNTARLEAGNGGAQGGGGAGHGGEIEEGEVVGLEVR